MRSWKAQGRRPKDVEARTHGYYIVERDSGRFLGTVAGDARRGWTVENTPSPAMDAGAAGRTFDRLSDAGDFLWENLR